MFKIDYPLELISIIQKKNTGENKMKTVEAAIKHIKLEGYSDCETHESDISSHKIWVLNLVEKYIKERINKYKKLANKYAKKNPTKSLRWNNMVKRVSEDGICSIAFLKLQSDKDFKSTYKPKENYTYQISKMELSEIGCMAHDKGLAGYEGHYPIY